MPENDVITWKDLNILCDHLHNPRDRVILRLLFDGVGMDGISELTLLRKQNIDFGTGYAHLYTDYSDKTPWRTVKLRQETLVEVAASLIQEDHLLNNGDTISGDDRKKIIHTNDYIICEYLGEFSELKLGLPVDPQLIPQTLAMLAAQFMMEHLSPDLVLASGRNFSL